MQNTSDFVTSVVEQGVKYLDTRSVFWRQQVPAQALHVLDAVQRQEHARIRQEAEAAAEKEDSLKRKYKALLDDVMRCNQGLLSFTDNFRSLAGPIDIFCASSEFLEGNYTQCIELCEKCLENLRSYKSSELSNKYDIVSSLWSVAGNAHFERERYKQALDCYQRDLDIANDR